MKYATPKISQVYSAVAVVQSGMKGTDQPNDALHAPTVGAYEADE